MKFTTLSHPLIAKSSAICHTQYSCVCGPDFKLINDPASMPDNVTPGLEVWGVFAAQVAAHCESLVDLNLSSGGQTNRRTNMKPAVHSQSP